MGTETLSKQPTVLRMFVIQNALAYNTTRSSTLAGNNGSNAFTGLVNPDIPRSLDVTFAAGWNGGNVTIIGTDQFDAAVTEVIVAVANTTVLGIKTFKTITSASKGTVGASAAVAQIVLGARLGIPARIVSTQGLLVLENNAGSHPNQFGSTVGFVDTTYNNVRPGDSPDGAFLYSIVVQVYYP